MSTLTVCIRHPSEAAEFRCRQCNDSVCIGCRAPNERDLCSICGEYRRDAAEVETRATLGLPVEPVRRESRAGMYLMGALFALNLALGGYLLLKGPQENSELAQEAVKEVEIVSRAVEESKDAYGQYPASLDAIVDRLPEASRNLVRAGTIVYSTDEERTTFEVARLLGPPGPDTSKP